MPRSNGPFGIFKKIFPNAYKADLLGEYGVSTYYEESEEILSLRSNSNQAREDDGDYPRKPLDTLPHKPKPAKRSKKVKEFHVLVRNYLNKLGSE